MSFYSFSGKSFHKLMATNQVSQCNCIEIAGNVREGMIVIGERVIALLEKAPNIGGSILRAINHDIEGILAKLESQVEEGLNPGDSFQHSRCSASKHKMVEIEFVWEEEKEQQEQKD